MKDKDFFKKGAYIVLIKYPVTVDYISNAFPLNYIFKQREDSLMLLSAIDATGSRTNGWSIFKPSGKHRTWRDATHEEINKYEFLGKPYLIDNNKKIDDFSLI